MLGSAGNMRLPGLNPPAHLSAIQIVAVCLWMQFLSSLLSADHLPCQVPWLQQVLEEVSGPQLQIRIPEAEQAVRSVRVVAKRGAGLVWESRTLDLRQRLARLDLPRLLPGRLSIKAIALDEAGCIVYGGGIEAVILPRSMSQPVFQIDMKKLDVPLCN
jgi:hypothetical protein